MSRGRRSRHAHGSATPRPPRYAASSDERAGNTRITRSGPPAEERFHRAGARRVRGLRRSRASACRWPPTSSTPSSSACSSSAGCSSAASRPASAARGASARGGCEGIAFQKAFIWACLVEVLGFGCMSGPLGFHIWPPFTAFLHFLRPGTIKLAPFPNLPLFGGTTRTWFDVALYAAFVASLLRALVAPAIGAAAAAADRRPAAALRPRRQDDRARGARRASLRHDRLLSAGGELDRRRARPCSSRSGSGPACRSSPSRSATSSR